jgi:N,N'-diacetyllegionaminate synthase
MVFVVAEIGVNWNGDIDLAKDMIFNAKKAGCDAVKFQSFNKEIVVNHPAKELLVKCSISRSNIEKIDQLSKNIGIEWFCTPMYEESVDILEPFVKRYKIRVADGKSILKNEETSLFNRVLKTGKEIIVSCETSPKKSVFYSNNKIKWIYCVPKYPCELSDLDFTNFQEFNGFSNHCPKIIAPLTAAILGGEIIEVHITSDKNKGFFDNNVSFDYKELNELVRLIRLSEEIRK